MKKRKNKADFICILLFVGVLVGCGTVSVKEFRESKIWKAEETKEEEENFLKKGMQEWKYELLKEIDQESKKWKGMAQKSSILKEVYQKKLLPIEFVAEKSVLVKYNEEWIKISKLPFIEDEYIASEQLEKQEQMEKILEEIEQLDKMQEEKETKAEIEEEETKEVRYEDIHATRPEIPLKGEQLSDFIPENWELFNQASLDFNQDGVEDFVGIIKYIQNNDLYTYDHYSPFFPYILFAIASEEGGGYRLDFQDVNLIKTWREAAMSGIVYHPIITDGISFTTDIEGGTAATQVWKEKFTYTYKNGTWYLTTAERTYWKYKMDSYQLDNYETGIGIRKEYCGTVGEAEEALQEEFKENRYEEINGSWYLVYAIELDEAPTLSQTGMRKLSSLERVWEWSVESIVIKEGIDIDLDEKLPLLSGKEGYMSCNEDGVCYSVREKLKNGGQKYYLFYYQWKSLSLSVLAESESHIMDTVLYKGKIYYFSPVILPVYYYNDEGEVRQGNDWTGLKLYQMNVDGTNHQLLFEYHLPRAGRGLMEDFDSYYSSTNSYMSFIIRDVTEKELIVSVFEGTWMPIYRIDLDSKDADLIGYYRLEGYEDRKN